MNLTSSEQREYDAELNFMSILFHHIELLECTIIQDEYFQFKDFRKLFSLLKQHKEVNAGKFLDSGFTNIDLMLQVNDYFRFKNSYESQFRYYEGLILQHYKSNQLKDISKKVSAGLIEFDEFKEKLDKIDSIKPISKKEHPTKEEYIEAIAKHNDPIKLGRFKQLSYSLKLESDDLITVSAPPNYGKTPFLMNLFIECLNNKNNYCQYYNLEVNSEQVVKRLIAISSKKTIDEVCHYSSNKDNEIEKSIDMLSSTDHYLNNEPMEWETLRANIIMHIRKDKQNIVFIDYLGLISLKDRNYNKTNYDKVTYIMKELRKLCRKYNVLVFVASQCNRDALKDKGELTMYSLKDSGEVENSSTHVILLYEDKEKQQEFKHLKNVKVNIAKNRNYYTRKMDMLFNGQNQYFSECEI